MSKFGAGQSIRRVEDARLLTGAGRYTDDINLPGQAYGYVLRSPFAHARIRSINVDAARSAPGVVEILTGAELEAEGANALPCDVEIASRDGTPGAAPRHPILCADTVRYVGDNVAFVVAGTLVQAKDAAELIEVDYAPLDAVTDTKTAADPGMPRLHDDVPENLAFDWEFGDPPAVDAAFARAAHLARIELVNNRVVVNSMEPRGVLADYAAGSDRMTLYTGTQGGWNLKPVLAEHVLKVAPEKVRIITPDVGGGFGMKAFLYPEHAMAAWASRKLRRPVKWTGERSDAFLSDTMGRDHVTQAALAFDADRRIIGMRVETTANLGAYLSFFAPFIPTGAAVKVLPGVYDVKCLHYRVMGVFTNTTPVDAYRGAGRPESIYLIERLIDKAAREFGEDPAELRRRCFIPPEAMPFTSAAGETYDVGEFARVMDAAMAKADWRGFPARRAEARGRGARRGIGMCYYIESTMGEPEERASIRFEEDGMLSVLVGTQSNGQGHETAYAQLLNDRLGIPLHRIRVIQGDTDRIRTGGGTGGSRSLTSQGWAIHKAADVVIERGIQYASQELEAAAADVEFDGGRFTIVGTDRSISILDLAAAARSMASQPEGHAGGLDADALATIDAWTFPNGCHIAEVEIDGETGVTRIVRYSIVDDFGVVLNPMLVEGQVHGGVVQGIGQALYEHTVYDGDGQLLTGSFMDYCVPRADNIPSIEFSTIEVPCKNNPMGVKGCGEAGAVASPAAVINAVLNALADLGVEHIDMPATPYKVWKLLHRD
ncbi:MAG: xanthine dehydrogenase family protein molybdopterin-binding subunit [Alphaproteobacteria bacterium]